MFKAEEFKNDKQESVSLWEENSFNNSKERKLHTNKGLYISQVMGWGLSF